MNCVVYALYSSEDGAVRYVGQTKASLPVRLRRHVNEARRSGTHRGAWIRSVVARGFEVRIKPLVIEAEWNTTEMAVIRSLRQSGARLVNATAGGEGIRDPSSDVRRKLGERARARRMSEEQKRKRSEAMTGKPIPHQKAMIDGARKAYAERGEEISRKLSAALVGKKRSAEVVARVAASLRGRRLTVEQRQRLSEANRVRFADPDQRRMTSAATKAAMARPDVQRRMREGLLKIWSPERRKWQAGNATRQFASEAARHAQRLRREALSADQVREIRRRYAAGERGKALAREFGVVPSVVSTIVTRRKYAHVE